MNSWETRRHSSRQDGQGIHRGMKGPGGRPLGPKCQGPGLAWHFVWLCCFFVDLSPSFLSPLTFAREKIKDLERQGRYFIGQNLGRPHIPASSICLTHWLEMGLHLLAPLGPCKFTLFNFYRAVYRPKRGKLGDPLSGAALSNEPSSWFTFSSFPL